VVIHTKDSGDFLWTLEKCRFTVTAGYAWPGSCVTRRAALLQLAAEAASKRVRMFRERCHARKNSPAALAPLSAARR